MHIQNDSTHMIMLNRFIFSALLVFTFFTGFSQNRIGISATPQFSWLRSDDKKIEGAGSNFGFRTGIPLEIAIGDGGNFFLSTGFNFSFNQGGTIQNGYARGIYWPESDLSEARFDTVFKDAQLTYHVSYFDIPFGVKMLFPSISGNDNIKPYFEFLPSFSFKMGAKGDIANTTDRNTDGENIKQDIQGFAFNLTPGAGVEISLGDGSAHLGLGVFYLFQLTDMTKNNDGKVYDTLDPMDTGKQEDARTKANIFGIRLGLFQNF